MPHPARHRVASNRQAPKGTPTIRYKHGVTMKCSDAARKLILGALLVGGAANAQVLIGQTAGFTGPVASGVKETSEGAKLYIDAINARGGVHGQKIELIQM